MENTNSTFTVHYGKGEYAITSANVDRLTKAVDHFNQTAEWKWSLQDCLGINQDGKLGKRFEEIKKSLATIEEPAIQNLLTAMSAVVVHEASEIKKVTKTSSVERENRRTEVFGILSTTSGLTEKEIEKMVRSI
jgi:hypothetical protein